jgi:hexosaminidase
MKLLLKLTPIILGLLILSSCAKQSVIADYSVVPLPKEVTYIGKDIYSLNKSTKIIYDDDSPEMKENANTLALALKEITGIRLTAFEGNIETIGIKLNIDSTLEPEGYTIDIDKNGINISGGSNAGVFYGIQTIIKSIPIKKGNQSVSFPCAKIKDAPRFGYRGAMLDVGRHFFSVDSVKQFIDILALHNINRMHWHLSEDQGWRMEIKKYPKLTEIGSKRKETVIGHNSGEYDNTPYEGFYTQEQIKDIIEYAQKKYITIVPEIDLPGHQIAALASYPELGCTGGPYEVWTKWGVSDDVICAGNDNAIQFLKDVLEEVMEVFPSEYIHIGGDECPKTRWKDCPKCQARIRKEGIKGDDKHSAEDYLQSYVTKEIEKFVESKGRHIIGWDEILEGELAPNATVMSWRGVSGGIEAAKKEHNVIMSPNTYLYFDYYQSKDTEHEPIAIGGYLPLEKVYSFEPTEGIPEEYKKYIVGVQANVWTEYISTFSKVEYMTLPRLAALAEVQWCAPSQKDYKEFLGRVAKMQKIYEYKGYNYAKHLYDVVASFKTNNDDNIVEIELSTYGDGDIHYTLDGSTPDEDSEKYSEPISVGKDAVIKACVINDYVKSRVFTEEITFSKSTAKPIELRKSRATDINPTERRF